MAKHAQAKGNTGRKASNGKHGRTFCRWCDAKIARGMDYCNNEHRQSFQRFLSASARDERRSPNTGILASDASQDHPDPEDGATGKSGAVSARHRKARSAPRAGDGN